MNRYYLRVSRLFMVSALLLLLLGLLFGFLGSLIYLFPDFLKNDLDFSKLRPMHVSSVICWILLGATGCVYSALAGLGNHIPGYRTMLLQWILWIVAIAGIFYSYITGQFGGREYWEFPPQWALPIAAAWLVFLVNFLRTAIRIPRWPVYIWMWMTGCIFFLFIFIENYLWIIPYFRTHFVTDMTIQWKVNGSLVGAWNQLIYGTAFYLTDKISNNHKVGHSRLAFGMYFLGLFNLMFNWGHHIYTLPAGNYIRYTGYLVSMTEWIFFARIIYNWKRSLNDFQKSYHYFPYRFLIASEAWVFINMGQAILMSIPAINIYTHGTHITVAHAMGTTIGINSMILMAALFIFMGGDTFKKGTRIITPGFYMLQVSLVIFWLSLNIAGIKKGIWQLSPDRGSFSRMMTELHPWFQLFSISGFLLLVSFFVVVFSLLAAYFRKTRR